MLDFLGSDFGGGGGGGFGGFDSPYPTSGWSFALPSDAGGSTPSGQAGGNTGASTSPGQAAKPAWWEVLLGTALGGYTVYSQNQLANKAIKYQTGLNFTPQGSLLGVGSGAAGAGLSGLIPIAIVALIAIIGISLVFKAIR